MSERLNVKGMLVEPEAEKRHFFIPERDVTPEQKEALVQSIDHWAPRGGLDYALDFACAAHLAGMKVEIRSQYRRDIQNTREGLVKEGDWHDFAWMAAREKIIGLPVELAPVERHHLENYIVAASGDDFTKFVMVAVSRKILGIHSPVSQSIRDIMISSARLQARQEHWNNFAWYASRSKILGNSFILSEDEMRQLRFTISDLATNTFVSFAELVFSNAVLSATEVVIPEEGGLQLIWHADAPQNEDLQPRPEGRNF